LTPAFAALILAADLAAPHVRATKTDRPLQLDGVLDEAAWKTASALDGFTQRYPIDGARPSEHTTMRVLYDEEALYVGFDCEQVHSPVLEHLSRRDQDSESEWVSIFVDPRVEGKAAFAFSVNVSGVLMDSIFTNPNNFDTGWDENWEARTARTPTGWSAELRIPFRVLRFDAAPLVQSWGFQAWRYIAQNQEADYWSYFPRDVANPIVRFGRLDGVSNPKPAGSLELRPFVTGDVRHQVATDVTTASGFAAQASAGLDLKWHITQDLTLDGALRPDFAQVEADQVILNLTNYETFLPEKRPLFLEGNELFSFPIPVFYSRRVGFVPTVPTLRTNSNCTPGTPCEKLLEVPAPATIWGAAKVTGHLGSDWTVGALTALTGRNLVTVEDPNLGPSNRLVAPVTSYNLLRLRREWGASGHVGLIAMGTTTFEGGGGYPPVSPAPAAGLPLQLCPSGAMPPAGARCFRDSYVAGVDTRWRSPSGDYVVDGAVIESHVHGGPPTPQLDGTVIGPGADGAGGWLRLAKEGGRLLASASYSGAGRTLDYNDLGFMPRQNLHEVKTSLGYRTLSPGWLTVETSSAFEVTERRSLSGLDLGQIYSLYTRLRLQNFWTLFLAADVAPAHFDDREVGNGAALERGGYVGARIDVGTDPKRAVFVDLSGQGQLIQNRANAVSAQGTLTLRPLPQLEISLFPQLTWSTGEPRYTSQTDTMAMSSVFGTLTATSVSATLRAGYTFAPRLSLQAYAQAFLAAGHFSDLHQLPARAGQQIRISDVAAAPPGVPAANPDFEEAALNLNLVFRWEYRLGSTLFLVYSRSQAPEIGGVVAPASLQPRALGVRASADVILLKATYWWPS
jgi:hypothetical protein